MHTQTNGAGADKSGGVEIITETRIRKKGNLPMQTIGLFVNNSTATT